METMGKKLQENKFDVIVVGGGIGGLYTALKLDPSLRVLLLTKRDWKLCNTSLAQGGVAAVYHPGDDSLQLHTNDTLMAGGFKNNLDAIKLLVAQAEEEIQQLIDLGVDFDRKEDGSLNRGLEGGHSRRRIFHHQDSTGFELVTKLYAAVEALENVTIMEQALVSRIKETATGFSLEVLINPFADGGAVPKSTTYHCRNCVLATGGVGRVYEYTTNSAIATGDGIMLAYELGARIRNLSLVQFHPTAFNNKHTRECFLISEAVRGEGAYLVNCHKERFMHHYDDRLELAPRDVVSHSIIEESRKTGSTEFFLDITHKDPEFLKKRFPMIYTYLLSQGIDMTKEPIPIFPCQHYLMGGIQVSLDSDCDVEGLYAVGECAHTGVHGNNRLASNSLLEALVFGHQAAAHISQRFREKPLETASLEEYVFEARTSGETLPHGIRTEIRSIMQESYFVFPNVARAVDGFKRITEIKEDLESGRYNITADFIEAKSLATIAYLILKDIL